ncbi:MAG: hypothetical protein J6J05_09945 [Peptococcaceae bacterium]|nr:hypothetical protein [Peptococcaceae bacterium]MBP3626131.1 hypothetical protein [Peptococcaceae bacterium]
MSSSESKSNYKWIHVIIAFVLTFGFGYIPAPEPITHMGMQIMGVFLGMLWGWCFVGDMIWPSLLGIVALGMTEYTTVTGSLTLFFQNTTTQQMLCTMIFFGYMDKCGLSGSLARWILARPFINGRPWVLAIVLFVAEAILSSLVSLIVTILVIWQIFQAACEEMGYKKMDAYPAYVMIGTLICGSFGSGLLYFKGAGILLTGLIRAGTGTALTMIQYILTADVLIFGFIALYVLIGFLWVRPDVSNFTEKSAFFDNLRKEGNFFKPEQKPQIISLIAFTVALFAIGLWPKTAPFYAQLQNIGIQGAAIIITMIMVIVQTKEGTPELNFKESFFKGVNWEMLLLLGASFPVADAIKSNDAGLVAFASSTLTPMLQDLGFIPFLIVISLAMVIISQFAHNLILQMVFIPITCPIVAAAGFSPLVSSVVIFYACNFAWFTPGASMLGAMFFGSDWINNKDIFKWLLPYGALCLVFLIAYMMFANAMFF